MVRLIRSQPINDIIVNWLVVRPRVGMIIRITMLPFATCERKLNYALPTVKLFHLVS